MASEQYKTGNCLVTNASQIIIGDGTAWSTEVSLPAIFKVDLDGESTYSIGSVVSATRIILAANYSASTNSGLSYMICRSFTTNRTYWRPLQGDADWAEILSQETVDKIDTDIDHIMSGNATIDGTIDTSFGIDTDGNCLRIKSTNLSASRQYHFPDYNASIPSSLDIADIVTYRIATGEELTIEDYKQYFMADEYIIEGTGVLTINDSGLLAVH